jgi:hypothetical protein
VKSIITLLTDFGTSDPYVGVLKGVILSINPDVALVDISHAVTPQNIEEGAFLLATALPYFPRGTIHVAVVDPGVGTQRRALALVTPEATIVGPDNGLLSAALPDDARSRARPGPARVPLPPGFAAYALADPKYFRHPVSATFHGRDVFAPVAAHLSLGLAPRALGPAVRDVLALPPFRAVVHADGSLAGRVLHVDHFGNLITSVRGEQIRSSRVTVQVLGHTVHGLASTYAHSEGLTALIGSSGFLEIARSGASAARELGAMPGDPITVREA